MKTVLHILFFICLGSATLFSQTKSLGEIDQQILYLKTRDGLENRIEKVKDDSSMTSFSHSNEGLKLFIVKESGKTVKMVEWYFFEEQLIYTETNWWDPVRNKLLFNEKTYHQKGKLIAWINSENTFADSNSEEFRKLDRELQKYATKLLKAEEE